MSDRGRLIDNQFEIQITKTDRNESELQERKDS